MQITHCPQCETAFKVSPQQLELAKGWVRCGRCSHVFEAALHFETPPDIPVAPLPNAEAPSLFRAAMSPAVVANEVKPSVQAAQADDTDAALPLKWVVSAGVLVLALLMQLLVAQRNWLAAEEPALRPLLSAMCACEVTWPREPDAVLIESSSFTENPDGGYIVQLRLKNTQHHAVAMPALELSLTDLQDQVLVRRVFTADELSAKDHVQALRDVRSTLNFDLDDKVSKRITGFRALVFYP
ncbi:hypothetical protein B9Z36_10125 [Limnohabitans sp. Rim8]|jgi:predicted Zn finger-like uncharacterized protein|uniref:zinc-ribbon and DUF3426 domain-containing protein n=1 Tax=Limnohabitans sp. Rim8 TaxID=1100718 RepID=UPI000D353B90|nr:zinc-ribbon and DUF3426 domain-containing protein [Limnohabitans sp. Rim8]PUE56644.1 hypothetical protein B9Z36_10125 [Limnohabitans sp. Rim8]